MFRKLFGLGSFCLALSAVAPQAHAAFVFFNVPGIHAGESARVAEQIVCANFACTVADYQFYVLNTGIFGIDGFALGLGAVPGAIAQNNTSFATFGGGGDGPFPNQPGAVANGGTGVLGPCGPAACNPAFAGPAAWAFEEFQDPGTFGGLPATYYVVRWYSPIQGLGAAKLLPGRYTRMDLFTVYPPAGGGGAVDPLSGDFIGFDSVGDGNLILPEFNNDTDFAGTNDASDTWGTPCDPVANSCGSPAADPTADSQFQVATSDLAAAPEPGTSAMLCGGLGLAALLLRRRNRRK